MHAKSLFLLLALSFSYTALLSSVYRNVPPSHGQVIAGQSNSSATFYISPNGNDQNPGTIDQPFATINRAKEYVNSVKSQIDQPITVYLRQGTYFIDNTIIFTPQDSGLEGRPITYQSYPGEKAIISGGKQLKLTWKLSKKAGVYWADISQFIDKYGYFYSLYFNGELATRARSPNLGQYFNISSENGKSKDSFYFNKGDLRSTWYDLGKIEIVSHAVDGGWQSTRNRIKKIDQTSSLVTLKTPAPRPYSKWLGRYYVENFFEGLDADNEWYLDRFRRRLYFKPATDINQITFTVPVVNQLLQIGSAPQIVIEAKKMDLDPQFQIGSSTQSGQDKYIEIPNGYGDNPDCLAESPRASHSFQISSSGDYVLEARMQSPDPLTDNLFCIQVDSGPVDKFKINQYVSQSSVWQFFQKINLSQGIHTITFYHGKDGSRLYAIRLSQEDITKNLVFKNLNFIYTDWYLPVEGHAGAASGRDIVSPPAVNLYLTDNVQFVNNKFNNIGAFGLGVYGQNSLISFNKFQNLGAGAIVVSDWTRAGYDFVHHNKIANNKITNFGLVFKEGDGIWDSYSHDELIAHNDISSGANNAISMGWWGCSVCRDNQISFNKIKQVKRELYDGGGIYFLSKSPQSSVNNNIIANVKFSPLHNRRFLVNGIYLDEYTDGVNVTNNLVYNSGEASLYLHSTVKNCTIKNNIFVNGGLSQIKLACPNCQDNTFKNNIIYSSNTAQLFDIKFSQPSGFSFSDNNLFFHPNHSSLDKDTWNLSQWKSTYNFDQNSIVADPIFVNVGKNNYNLRSNSPAFGLGFQPIDFSRVGIIQ